MPLVHGRMISLSADLAPTCFIAACAKLSLERVKRHKPTLRTMCLRMLTCRWL